jgi:hypothetical protein
MDGAFLLPKKLFFGYNCVGCEKWADLIDHKIILTNEDEGISGAGRLLSPYNGTTKVLPC